MSQEERIAIQDAVERPKRKWRRWVVWLLLILPLGLMAIVLVIGQTPVMRMLVEPIIADQLGIDVAAQSITLLPNGDIEINKAVCRDSKIKSKAGEMIAFDRAMIDMNWLGVLKGSGQVESIVVEHPIVRVSQNIESGALNLASMKFKSGGGGGPAPAIEIRDGLMQISEHDGSTYRVLKELSFNGQLTEQTQAGVSGFDFQALPVEPSMGGALVPTRGAIGLSGQISDLGIVGVVDGVRLEDWPAEIVPSRSRGIYERLDLAGTLDPTKFTVSPDGLVEVVLTLKGVALNLPFDDTGSMTEPIESPEDLLRMRRTRGVIKFGTSGVMADLTGELDEIEYDVMLELKGLDANSELDATVVTDFRLDEHFKPAKFLPEKVLAKLDRFENPTADVHAEVSIKRKAGKDQSLDVSGIAKLTNGSAIYKKFRYPFTQIAGEIEFDPDQLVVRNITGVGPTGATMVTNGLFSPLGEHSVVTLDLAVRGVKIDEYLLDALDDQTQQLVNALFSETEYQKLIDERVVLSSEDVDLLGDIRRSTWDQLDAMRDDPDSSARRAELQGELASLDHALAAPVFDFRGSADVDVQLVRHPERPSDQRWTTDVHVMLPEAGIVSKHFPLPIRGEHVEIFFNDQRIALNGGSYTGLGGGQASVDVAIDLTKQHAKPIINVKARGFPIDQAFIRAIPGYDDPQSPDRDQASVRRILDRLHLGGTLDCDALIGPRSDGRLGYDVETTVFNGHAAPSRLPGVGVPMPNDPGLGSLAHHDPISFDDLYATVYLTEEMIVVDLEGMLGSPTQPLAPTHVEMLTQLTMPPKMRSSSGVKRVDGLLPDEFGPALPGPQLYADGYADGLDLAMEIEHAMAVVSPKLAREFTGYRSKYTPDGVLGMGVTLEGVIGGEIVPTIKVDRVDDLGVDYENTRYWFGSSWGQGELVWSTEPKARFDGFRVSIESQSGTSSGPRLDAGELSLDGSLSLTRGGRYLEITKPEKLAIDFQRGTFESPITRGVLDGVLKAKTGQSGESAGEKDDGEKVKEPWYQEHQLAGQYDLQLELSPQLGMHHSKSRAGQIAMVPTKMVGELMPRSLGITMGDQRARFDQVSGQVLFEGFGGRLDSIEMSDAETSLSIRGPWSAKPDQGLGFDLSVDAKGKLLTGPVRALLPGAVDRVIDQLQIETPSVIEVNDLSIIGIGLGTPRKVFDLNGRAGLVDGSAMIGLPLSGIQGDMGFAVHGTNETLGYEINIEASRLRAGAMRVHDAQVSIIGDANNHSVVLIPEISAGMHGGQIAGSAQILPGSDGESEYWLEMHASGVRAAPVFDDLLLPPEGLAGPPRPGQTAVLSSWSLGEDISRGTMIADLTLTGPVGDRSKRSGRGLIQIEGGSVVSMPGVLPLIEASNLSLPASSPLDLAQASFYVDGDVVAFEQLSASSERIEILGYGTMEIPTKGVDLRFRSRAVHPIPLLSRLVEQIRDELITTRVTGVLGDLQYSVAQFGSTRKFIDALMGRQPSDQQRRMQEVQEQVNAHQGRSNQVRRDEVHRPSTSARAEDDWD